MTGVQTCALPISGISLYAPSEGTFFHFADYRTDEVNKLKGEPSAKKIAIVHSASYRTSFSYSALSHTYAMQMYNSSKKATENTVDELLLAEDIDVQVVRALVEVAVHDLHQILNALALAMAQRDRKSVV